MPAVTDPLFDTHAVVAVLRDGRVIAESEYAAYASFASDGECDVWLQRVPDLKYIEYVLEVQFDWGIPRGTKTQTISDLEYKMNVYGEAGKSILGNVVGMTLLGLATRLSGGTLTGAAYGTTVYAKVIAIGPP